MASLILAVLMALAGAAQALDPGDGVVVRFKDGTSLSGVLVSLSPSQVVIDVGGAQAGWPMSDVSQLQAAQTDVETFQEMLKAAGNDPSKLQEAAVFAREHGLETYYDELMQEQAPGYGEVPPSAPPSNTLSQGQQAPPAEGSALAPLPTLGYGGAGPPTQTGTPAGTTNGQPLGFDLNPYSPLPGPVVPFGVAYLPPPPATPQQQQALLQAQQAAQQARSHEVTNPISNFQFNLQQYIDRSATGLPPVSPQATRPPPLSPFGP